MSDILFGRDEMIDFEDILNSTLEIFCFVVYVYNVCEL